MRYTFAIVGLAMMLLLGCSKSKHERFMAWSDPLDPVASTTESVASKSKPVLFVVHKAGPGGWQFLDEGEVMGQNLQTIPKEELLTIDPTLKELTDLPGNWEARRTDPSAPWVWRQR
jgi:hypothetical protein